MKKDSNCCSQSMPLFLLENKINHSRGRYSRPTNLIQMYSVTRSPEPAPFTSHDAIACLYVYMSHVYR